MVRTQIQLEKEELRKAQAAAARAHLSLSAFVRRSLCAALEECERDEVRKEAARLPGKYRSNLKDLARNHDRHLSDDW